MSGCFGNSPIDRAMESQLNSYLSSGDDYESFIDSEEAQEIIDEMELERNEYASEKHFQEALNDALDRGFKNAMDRMREMEADYLADKAYD